ncbi:uncharacterized protein EDB93DRAFT_1104037 [Suillus bovinus]|uniref:uncharacterized protein n=1 Tax=Suillus bovinus TaxID=48563 RepID=UPI001B87DB4F|nr:uncharacterized protein EDB93DRAFT_1104037 [Suillus bovinus]KAG2147760.1 hypothetical protein EDB93DRAFT_1104037 [Suillus bovinus]
MFQESGIGNGEPGTQSSIFGSKHSVLDAWYPTFQNSVIGTQYLELRVQYSELDTRYLVFGNRVSALGSRYSDLAFGNWVLALRSQCSDLAIGSQHSGVNTRTSVVMFWESGISNGESGTRSSIFGTRHSVPDISELVFVQCIPDIPIPIPTPDPDPKVSDLTFSHRTRPPYVLSSHIYSHCIITCFLMDFGPEISLLLSPIAVQIST